MHVSLSRIDSNSHRTLTARLYTMILRTFHTSSVSRPAHIQHDSLTFVLAQQWHARKPQFHRIQIQRCCCIQSDTAADAPATVAGAKKYGWTFEDETNSSRRRRQSLIKDLPVAAIRRPLGRTRENDQEKVEALMASISEIGLQEPIDVLEVDGVYYGFSGCHRFEAHQRLGKEFIRCRVRKATPEVLKMHMM